jgi:hypothetical protein
MDSDAPTCKVVKRTYGGSRKGARIHPKGCKVRSIATRPYLPTRKGIKKYNKRGVRKRKIKTDDNRLKVFVNKSGTPFATSEEFLWDTGAQPACICGFEIARQWGLLLPAGGFDDYTGSYPSSVSQVTGASGVPIPARKFRNFPIKINWHGHRYGPINVTVPVCRGRRRVIDVPSIAHFRKLGLSVSFKAA